MSLLEFYEAKRPRSYRTEWYHKWMASTLERAYTERKNAIFELPPRHGKSELVNVYGPAWRLGEVYDENFMLVTNSDNLAKKFSTATRALIPAELEADRDAQWKIKGVESLNYSYQASGVRGQMTGHGASVLIFDDLLKSGAEAKSDTVRETVWENIVSAAVNRLSPDGIVVAMQARLHLSDPVGKLAELEHLKFLRLHLPATNPGGLAWFDDGYSGDRTEFPPYTSLSQRYPAEKLADIQATVTPYYWNAQYQQTPSMGDLAYFDVERMPVYRGTQVERCWIFVDAANTETKSGSFTAFGCLGLFQNTLKLLSMKRGRWRQDIMQAQLLDFYDSCTRLTGLRPEAVIVERAAGGYGLIDHFAGQLPIIPVIPQGSKEERAGAVCWIVNRGQVALPESAPWLAAFKEELQNFPLSAQKDQVDAFVHGLSYALRPSEFKPQERSQSVVYDTFDDYEGQDTFDSDYEQMFGSQAEVMGAATLRALARRRQ
jgi:predicted phage terminase large subunit-like protein